MEETWVRSLGWEDPLEGGHGHPLQYSCLENPQGQRSLAGYGPWGGKEPDTTERLTDTHTEDMTSFVEHVVPLDLLAVNRCV